MSKLLIEIDEKLHQELRVLCIKRNMTIKKAVTQLIESALGKNQNLKSLNKRRLKKNPIRK